MKLARPPVCPSPLTRHSGLQDDLGSESSLPPPLLCHAGLKLQGQIGKFGNVELSDVVAFVEMPDGKVRI